MAVCKDIQLNIIYDAAAAADEDKHNMITLGSLNQQTFVISA